MLSGQTKVNLKKLCANCMEMNIDEDPGGSVAGRAEILNNRPFSHCYLP